MLSLREAAQRLGGDVAGPRTILCPGPNHSPRDRSLSVTFDTGGDFIVFSHAGDDWQVCRDHVRDMLELGRFEAKKPQPRPELGAWRNAAPREKADPGKSEIALRIWKESRDASGTLAETYLASRGLKLDDRARESVRFHPELRFGAKTVPAMVALYRDLRTDEPRAIQRTFLGPDGTKLERWMLGPVQNAAVKLDPDDEVSERLIVGEGVESCLAAREYRYRPCWALGSAGAISRLPVLPGVERLAILGEKNDGGANERATRDCARRWKAEGAEVKWIEPMTGDDANDVLLAGRAE